MIPLALLLIGLQIAAADPNYVPLGWKFFDTEWSRLNQVKIKWQQEIPKCRGHGIEVTINDVEDSVCLTEASTCVYKGRFEHVSLQDATEVVATKDCPKQDPKTIAVSFKCSLLSGFNFLSASKDITYTPGGGGIGSPPAAPIHHEKGFTLNALYQAQLLIDAPIVSESDESYDLFSTEFIQPQWPLDNYETDIFPWPFPLGLESSGPEYDLDDLDYHGLLGTSGGIGSAPFREALKNISIDQRAFITPASFSLPKEGFEMDVMVYYDTWFLEDFHDGNHETAKIQLRAVMAHVQTYFNLPSLPRIQINAKGFRYLDQWFPAATKHLIGFKNEISALPGDEDIDAFIMVSYQYTDPGQQAATFRKTTCSEKGFRTSINEWFASDQVTAQIIARSLGHNLGMDHDYFPDSQFTEKQCFPDAPGPDTICNNVGGIMDLHQPFLDRWSCCSAQAFLSYYNEHDTFCLTPKKKVLKFSEPSTRKPRGPTGAPIAISSHEVPTTPIDDIQNRILRSILQLVSRYFGEDIAIALATFFKYQIALLNVQLGVLGLTGENSVGVVLS